MIGCLIGDLIIMFIEVPDRDIAMRLVVESSEYIHNLRNDWAEKTAEIIKEDVEFVNHVYTHPTEFQIRSIADKAFIIYGPKPEKNCLYIYELYVSPECRGKHYGKALLEHVIKYYKKFYENQHNLPYLKLSVDKNNYSAINFYKLNKFAIDETLDNISYDMVYTGKVSF